MQYTLPLSLPSSDDPVEDYICDTGGFIGVDANRYCIHILKEMSFGLDAPPYDDIPF